jgi:hypothetical protein
MKSHSVRVHIPYPGFFHNELPVIKNSD